MNPTIGRIVIYRFTPGDVDEGVAYGCETCPAVVTRVWATTVNLRLLVDGDRVPPHRRSCSQGDGPGQWQWPVQVSVAPPVAVQTAPLTVLGEK